jgi:hypothetical protein
MLFILGFMLAIFCIGSTLGAIVFAAFMAFRIFTSFVSRQSQPIQRELHLDVGENNESCYVTALHDISGHITYNHRYPIIDIVMKETPEGIVHLLQIQDDNGELQNIPREYFEETLT